MNIGTRASSPEALLQDARNAFTLGDFATAEKITRQVLSQAPNSINALILLGTIHGRQREFDKAVKTFKQALALDPANAEALNNLGVIYRQMGDLEQALATLEKAKEVSPESAEIWYNLGNIHKSLQNVSAAIEAYQRAIELNPDFVLPYNNLGTLYDSIGEYEKATEIFTKGLRADPNHPTLRYNLGIAFEIKKEFQDAKKHYELALRSRPGWIDGLNNLAHVLQELGDYDRALHTYKEILSIDPENYRAKSNIAAILAEQGRDTEAIEYLRSALETNPKYPKAIDSIGQLLSRKPPSADILQEFEKLVRANPDALELRLQYARALASVGKFIESETEYRQVCTAFPDHPEALRGLGRLYYLMGNKSKGEEFFQKALQLEGASHRFRLDLAKDLKERGNFTEAYAQIEEYLRKEPSSLEGLLLKGKLLIALEKYREAIQYFAELNERFPQNPEVLVNSARLYQLLGEKEAAIHTVDELVTLQSKGAKPKDLNSINESLELYEQAVKAFEQDHQEAWDRSLSRLSELVKKKTEEGPFSLEEAPQQEEESIPILDLRGTTISKEEAEEESPEEEESLKEDLEAFERVPPFAQLPEEGEVPPDLTKLRPPPFFTRGTKPVTPDETPKEPYHTVPSLPSTQGIPPQSYGPIPASIPPIPPGGAGFYQPPVQPPAAPPLGGAYPSNIQSAPPQVPGSSPAAIPPTSPAGPVGGSPAGASSYSPIAVAPTPPIGGGEPSGRFLSRKQEPLLSGAPARLRVQLRPLPPLLQGAQAPFIPQLALELHRRISPPLLAVAPTLLPSKLEPLPLPPFSLLCHLLSLLLWQPAWLLLGKEPLPLRPLLKVPIQRLLPLDNKPHPARPRLRVVTRKPLSLARNPVPWEHLQRKRACKRKARRGNYPKQAKQLPFKRRKAR
jgi:tetratricopeptide (TPR) repeat protein